MPRTRSVAAVAVLAIVLVASFAVYETYFAQAAPPCQPLHGRSFARTQTKSTTFGAVTEYQIPGIGRWPSSITAAPDGSVWFIEQELPGVAHLFPQNGTLLEYAWPGYKTSAPPDCVPNSVSAGVAIWNGRVWGADEFGNLIVGVNPSDGSIVNYTTAGKASFPYWLAVGPDGNLWFTSDNLPARLGRIFPNGTLSVINLSGMGDDIPLQLDFVNSTLAFVAGINLSGNKTVSCFCDGHVYSFDPAGASSSVSPSLVGGDYKIIEPTSVSYSQGRVWVTQHAASAVVSYDFATGAWTKYPTSRVPWTGTTLPYFIDANGSLVWFNEHYANKIAFIDPGAGTMTEFSETNPPITTNDGIQNDEFIAVAGGRLWFSSMSGNYVGYVNGGFEPGFHASVSGSNRVGAVGGDTLNFTLEVSGSWSKPMPVNFSDSEDPSSSPYEIQITPSVSSIPTGSSPFELGVAVHLQQSLPPGDYTIAVTVTNGGVQQVAYIFVGVTAAPQP